jgi:hypothetical protein
MFSANVIVVEHARLFLREYYYPAGTIGKSLKHVGSSSPMALETECELGLSL